LSKRKDKTHSGDKKRESVFQPEFREDLRYWVETDRKTALRIFQLIEAVMRDPFRGIGKIDTTFRQREYKNTTTDQIY
jgi:toxin YoeB